MAHQSAYGFIWPLVYGLPMHKCVSMYVLCMLQHVRYEFMYPHKVRFSNTLEKRLRLTDLRLNKENQRSLEIVSRNYC